MKSAQYEIREVTGEDIPFIYATWLESYRYDSNFGKSHRNNVFFNDYPRVIDLLLNESDVFVAASKDDANIIYGYLVRQNPSTLHYAFVKGPFRRWGIFSNLLDHAFPIKENQITYTHKTYTFIPIIDKFSSRLIFRGTALLKSFEGDKKDGKTEETTT